MSSPSSSAASYLPVRACTEGVGVFRCGDGTFLVQQLAVFPRRVRLEFQVVRAELPKEERRWCVAV
eukprot:3973781-Pyramimonas_sp.AAC.1